MIELRQVRAGYGKQSVLNDVSVRFEKGCLTGIIGINGCGKSTLLKAMLGMLPLMGGAITVDGCSLQTMTRSAIAKKMAYLSQGRSTPDMTVEQMVLHGRFPHLSYPRRYTEKDREIAYAAMTQVGIERLARKPLSMLSGGMRQNAYIAMALAQGSDYILLDEPMTYLDIAHQIELMKILRKLAEEGKGIVAVMHDLPMAFTFSDRIVLLDDGKVQADGEPGQICAEKTLKAIFGVSVEAQEGGKSYRYQY